ncbi:hypothetical protein [Rummeliibacillus suwonensis]|nr:hypothetical protein [Rummeliibacillus suwonensis]MBO2535268.1 hypothetical protein [Rummeliibacillus suwonensis]
MGEQLPVKVRSVRANRMLGSSGVATGCGVLNLSSSISVGDEENPP